MIRKAVVPIAGLGTRLFPASQACKKELFPVIGPDGIARPLLHYQVMDLLSAGIEQICIIVQPGEERLVRGYFGGPDQDYEGRLAKAPELLQELVNMKAALERLSFAVQATQEGYGHAVYQARAFAAGEPVLLCLGDHLFRGAGTSCHRQLIAAYAQCGGYTVSAVNRIGPPELKGYGTIAGRRLPENPQLVEVERIVEKPSIELARRSLRVDGLGPDEFLGWFGMHVLSPAIFEVLADMIARNERQKGEFQLTYAQELLRQREGYFALEMQGGRRFDFGTPQDYVQSVAAFAQANTSIDENKK